MLESDQPTAPVGLPTCPHAEGEDGCISVTVGWSLESHLCCFLVSEVAHFILFFSKGIILLP